MLDAVSAGLSGLLSARLRLDASAADTANAATTAYKPTRAEGTSVTRSFQQGPLVPAGGALSLALDGSGFFAVRRADGSPALTRAGDFRVDATGSIVTAAGERLDPPVTLPAGTRDVSVASDGSVSAGGTVVGRIEVVDVPAPGALMPLGGGLYAPTVGSGAPRPGLAEIRQGYLEASSVDLAEEVVDTILAGHEFAASAEVVRAADEQLAALLDIRRPR